MRAGGTEGVRRAALLEAQAAGENKIFIRLLHPSGVAFSSSNMSYWENIGINRQALSALIGGRRRCWKPSAWTPAGSRCASSTG